MYESTCRSRKVSISLLSICVWSIEANSFGKVFASCKPPHFGEIRRSGLDQVHTAGAAETVAKIEMVHPTCFAIHAPYFGVQCRPCVVGALFAVDKNTDIAIPLG